MNPQRTIFVEVHTDVVISTHGALRLTCSAADRYCTLGLRRRRLKLEHAAHAAHLNPNRNARSESDGFGRHLCVYGIAHANIYGVRDACTVTKPLG